MFASFYGVDFSGARLAGLNTWIARIEAAKRNSKIPVFKLTYLERLGGVCGADEREVALPGLVSLIAEWSGPCGRSTSLSGSRSR